MRSETYLKLVNAVAAGEKIEEAVVCMRCLEEGVTTKVFMQDVAELREYNDLCRRLPAIEAKTSKLQLEEIEATRARNAVRPHELVASFNSEAEQREFRKRVEEREQEFRRLQLDTHGAVAERDALKSRRCDLLIMLRHRGILPPLEQSRGITQTGEATRHEDPTRPSFAPTSANMPRGQGSLIH